MTDQTTSVPPLRRGPGGALALLFVLALLAALGWRGWGWWQARQAEATADAQARSRELAMVMERLDLLRRDQHAQAQRIARAEATNRVLRDEVLGVGQRAALLEDSIEKLADPLRNSAQALRLDEVELVLVTGLQRLQLAGDLAGARRAYAFAAGILDGVDDPAWLDLRQTLAQERAELDALGPDPRALAAQRLAAFAATLAPPADRSEPEATPAPWWRRALSRVVQVRPADADAPLAPADRTQAYRALQVELTLARAALERRDRDAWRGALARVDLLQATAWPDPALRRQRHSRLQALRALPLAPDLPALGSTLQQLRALRHR